MYVNKANFLNPRKVRLIMDLFRATSWKQSIIIVVRIVLVDVTSYSDNGKYQAVLLLRTELNLVGFK